MKNQSCDPNIDSRLTSGSQQAMAHLVKALPEEAVSMTWRADLNERIRAEARVVARRRRFAWFMGPATGFAVAGVFAIVLLTKSPMLHDRPAFQPASRSTASTGFEAGLFEVYHQDATSRFVDGSGPDPVSDANHSSIYDALDDEDSSVSDQNSL